MQRDLWTFDYPDQIRTELCVDDILNHILIARCPSTAACRHLYTFEVFTGRL